MSPESLSPLAIEEYRALRATIRERGTVRWIVIAVTFVAWAAIALSSRTALAAPLVCLAPLLVLAAGFETVFGLHVGVERLGRYLQARYETADGVLPQWEHAAMAAGDAAELRTGVDPLAAWVFASATLLNLAPFLAMGASLASGLTAGTATQLVVSVMLHALFLVRLFRARRFAAGQRANDLQFFSRRSSSR